MYRDLTTGRHQPIHTLVSYTALHHLAERNGEKEIICGKQNKDIKGRQNPKGTCVTYASY